MESRRKFCVCFVQNYCLEGCGKEATSEVEVSQSRLCRYSSHVLDHKGGKGGGLCGCAKETMCEVEVRRQVC